MAILNSLSILNSECFFWMQFHSSLNPHKLALLLPFLDLCLVVCPLPALISIWSYHDSVQAVKPTENHSPFFLVKVRTKESSDNFWLCLCNLKAKNIMTEITSSTAYPPLSTFGFQSSVHVIWSLQAQITVSGTT